MYDIAGRSCFGSSNEKRNCSYEVSLNADYFDALPV